MSDTGDRSPFERDEEVTTGELLETSRRLREQSQALMARIDQALDHSRRIPAPAPESDEVVAVDPAHVIRP